ncbi:VWA domain-containing protein [Ruegeria sp. HKCCD8929]|uniref:vWA domain-containing protein n=1 Tax=Ruegeria sp. HKCCD8929 TaxID=2683006 RepID=UPI0020C45B20|nr:VWA domain-containing protein [Ruegeria sp. HKCCD8929]
MIQLAFLWAFVLLPAPLLIWRFVPPHREKVTALRVPFFRQVAQALGQEPRAGAIILSRTAVQMITAALCWVLIVIALTRPERVGRPIEIEKSARDMILAIDVSGSMDTVDFINAEGEKLQRFAAVQEVVRDFVTGREGDRVALIVFGSKAYLQSPLTADLQTIVDLLDRTQVSMAGPHTALGDAIGLAIHTFEASAIDERVLILLSDGSDTASRMDPVNAAEIASDNGVTIMTIGVGNPDASGEDKVDLGVLEDVADRTGGSYFFAADQSALGEIYDRINAQTPRQVETLSYRPRQALAWIPLGWRHFWGALPLAG